MYFGLDIRKQSVKAVVVNEDLEQCYEAMVHFDSDLTEFRTNGGVNRDERNPKIITTQPLMWIKALDIVLEKLRMNGLHFDEILGVSGAAQQHGSVYWKRGGSNTLQNLNPQHFLHEGLAFAFTIQHSPVWMDSSTTKYTNLIEQKIGGPEKLAMLTGSRAYERFTGSQIMKIFHEKRDAYNATERISLVSSFICSIFLGNYASIDYSDGSGMNILNIKTKIWDQNILSSLTESPGTELENKLGNPVPANHIQGIHITELKQLCQII